MTGSNAKFLSKDIITEFRGHGWEIRVHPLSFSEYYEKVVGEKPEAFEKYCIYGGLPTVAQLERAEDKQNYLREIFETVYMRDVIDRNHLKNPDSLGEIVPDKHLTPECAVQAVRQCQTCETRTSRANLTPEYPVGMYIGMTAV